MIQEDLYLKVIEHNNICYSCDMLRLKCYMSYETYSKLNYFVLTYYPKHIKRYWESDKISDFKYNYAISLDEENNYSFYFGFSHNNERTDKNVSFDLYNFTIEFNPNKVRDFSLLRHILNLSSNWLLRSFDIAFDLKLNIRDIIFNQGRKHKVEIIKNGYDDLTYSIGGRGEGHIKIYNKKIESNLDINYDLTRVEVTRCFDDFPIKNMRIFDYGSEFPELYLNKYLYSFADYKDKTLMTCVFAVQSGYSLKDLSRRYQERVSKLFEGGCKIRFDRKSATQAISQVIYHYFVNNNSMQIIV